MLRKSLELVKIAGSFLCFSLVLDGTLQEKKETQPKTQTVPTFTHIEDLEGSAISPSSSCHLRTIFANALATPSPLNHHPLFILTSQLM